MMPTRPNSLPASSVVVRTDDRTHAAFESGVAGPTPSLEVLIDLVQAIRALPEARAEREPRVVEGGGDDVDDNTE